MTNSPKPVIAELYTFDHQGKAVFSGWVWSVPGRGKSHGPFKTYAAAQSDIARQARQKARA